METEPKKVFTLPELAEEYEVHTRTFYNWILPIREKIIAMNPSPKKRIRILLPKQVKFIREFLG